MIRHLTLCRALVALAAIGALVLPGLAGAQDDADLFSTQVPPNVVLLVDNSGSMNELVWHPAYDPTATPSCSVFSNTSSYTSGGNLLNWSVGCGRSINLYQDPALGNRTRFNGRYLNWLHSAESDPYRSEIEGLNNGTYSACLGGGTYDLYRRARITAAKDILREVICQVNAAGTVRFGLAKFRRGHDPEGGYIRVPATDYNLPGGGPNVYTLDGVTQSHADHLDDAISELTGEAWTPLAESLFQTYTYFMSRNAADRIKGADDSTVFPEYEYRTTWTVGNGGPHSTAGAPTVPDSPVQWSCQKNFVLVITDGFPTKDHFGPGSPDDKGFADFDDLIGDYNPDSEVEEPSGCSQCSLYLDDIAKFMQENDFRPDLDDEQVIDVYTVGFTTSPSANSLLQKTADMGNGLFRQSNNAEDLTTAIVDAITDIVRKSQSFTTPTVPSSRSATGDRLFTSFFIPSVADGFWEGHIRSWDIAGNGDILDSAGNCALDDPNPPSCKTGPFKPGAVPYWDAADEVPSPASRNLFTSKVVSPGVYQKVDFDVASMDETLLNVVAADLSLYPYPGTPAATEAELADMVVQNVRGCEFGTGVGATACVDRPSQLGDSFHSTTVVIPGPPGFGDASYNQFAYNYRHRDRMLVVGANDGFYHLFNAGVWDPAATPVAAYDAGTGAEVAGFMPYAGRLNAKQLAIDKNNRDYYFVDGPQTVVDAWFYTSPTSNSKLGDGSEWRTMVVSGLRQGGNHYFALDLTDPSSPSYPGYLWEFPREDAPASLTDFMAQTWSKPIITKIRVSVGGDTNSGFGYERWVAIFGGGYDPASDPNDHANYSASATAGRAIFIVDLKTGEIIGMKAFDAAASDGREEMLYSFAASPSVIDTNDDGYADVVYAADLGGQIWKWVVKDLLEDPVNALGDTNQPSLPFKKFFEAPVYNDGTNNFYKSFFAAPSATYHKGKLWLGIGSAERANLSFAGFTGTEDENNRFYAMRDYDPLENASPALTTVTEADLVDLSTNTSCFSLGSWVGFYVKAEDGEKFTTESDLGFSYVVVSSYKPIPSADPCDAQAEAFLYAFKIHCGEALFEDPSSPGTPVLKLKIGETLPTDPKIIVGDPRDPDDPWDPNDPRGTTSVISGSGDGVGQQDTGIDPTMNNGQAYWRELRLGE